MLKSRNLVVLALVATFGQAAWGQGTPFSLYGSPPPSDTKIGDVPAGGFVVTDILVTAGGAGDKWTLCEGDETSNTKCFMTSPPGTRELHLNTGVLLAGGTTARLTLENATGAAFITLIGYIPGPQPSVPAVGTWGLCVMVLLIVAGGTMVLRQRRIAV